MELIRKLIVGYNYFIAIYLAFYATYLLVSGIFGSIMMLKKRRYEQLNNVLSHDYYYPMSIIVPMYNEGISGLQTVENLLKLDYSRYEIIIVDDGSKDDTKQQLIDRFNLQRGFDKPIRYAVKCKTINEQYYGKINGIEITLISKDNGGCKADAVNAGINVCNYPYIVNMDGDEILQKDSLKYAARAILEEDDVIGVGGNLKISNSVSFSDGMPVKMTLGKNLLADLQTLEYSRGFIGAKVFQGEMNANLIISGGFGIYKKSAIVEVGGYDTTSMGEDMELTVKLHEHYRKNKRNYKMKYVAESVCWTQGPATMSDLKKQRQRWHCGLIQTLAKYKKMILNPKYGVIGMFMLPYCIMYELLNPIIMVSGWFVIVAGLYLHMLRFPFILIIYGLYILFSLLLSIISYIDNYSGDKKKVKFIDLVRVFGIGLADGFFFRPYLSVIEFTSAFKMKKLRQKWESPKRVQIQVNDK